MKAVRIHAYGGPDVLVFDDHVPEPPLSATSVLIKTTATSVNPIDWKLRSGARQKDFPLVLPAILGRDVSGVVHTTGSGVRDLKVGDRVVAQADATYAEFVAVESALVTQVPEGVSLEDVAAIPLIALTGDQLVRRAAKVQAGWTIVVTGALGSVGRAAVHSATAIGARVIAGVRGKDVKAAEALGASRVVALDDDAQLASLPELDAVADTVGGADAMKVMAKVRKGGHFGYASVLPPEAASLYPEVTIQRVFAQPDASKVREFADAVRDGRFVLPIGRRLPLRDVAEAHRLGEKGGVGKILLIV